MPALASGLDFVDVLFLGRPEIIATAILHGPAGVALIDPGPSTTLDTLTTALAHKGIGFADVRELLITHIHLDHAGATGTILERHPHIQVTVHERGAPHMVDPSKLLASAARLYGQQMGPLWGEVKAVPASNLHVVAGGETLKPVGREVAVAYTPGHASHHVSYLDVASHVAFVGDTAGILRGAADYVMPPTPPPDIDLDAWRVSAARVLEWDPGTLFLTHFGPHTGARRQFEALFENIGAWSRIVQRLLADAAASDDERQRMFVEEALVDLRHHVGSDADGYVRAGGLNYSYQGLARYWKKRSQA